MRLTVPITGTIKAKNSDGTFSGDPSDPIKMANIDLGDVSWRAVSFDLDASTMEIEVDVPKKTKFRLPGNPAKYSEELTSQELDDVHSGKVFAIHEEEPDVEHQARKAVNLANARAIVEGQSIEELRAISGSSKLKTGPGVT